MKLNEMGMIGRQAKIKDDAPSHKGEVGRIVNVSSERAYIEFSNGDKEWVANKHIVGTRKDTNEHLEGDEFPLTEMAAKKQCEHCGKTMAANHYWYKGGWKCKKAKSDDAKPAEKKAAPAKKEAPAEKKDDTPDRVVRDYVPKDANEKAAFDRAVKFHAEMERQVAKRKG